MRGVLGAVFPPVYDNRYRGHPVALWVFVALTALTLWRSQHHILAADGGAQSIATIALDRFSAGAADTVIFVFALWGISQLLLGLVYVVVLWRYRSMIPLMYLLFTAEYAMRLGLGWLKAGPVMEGTAPGGVVNLVFVLLGPVMLVLSVWRARAGQGGRAG